VKTTNETIEICMNDVVLENRFKENPSVQTKTSRNPKMAMKK